MSKYYQNDEESTEALLESQVEPEQVSQGKKGFLTSRGKIGFGAFVALSVVGTVAFINAPSTKLTDVSDTMMALNQAYFSVYGGSTGSNANSNELIYLDRHNIDCGSNVLHGFKMQPDVSYQFTCLSISTMPRLYQDHYDNGFHEDHHLIYYDRQSVSCPSDRLMTHFYGRNSHGNFGYGYYCAKHDWSHLSCSTHHTGYNEATDKSIVYLDRHDVTCPYSQGLQSFRGQGSGGQLRYEYTCCAINQHAPTAAPIASPTDSPTENPTFAPTVNETPLVCPVTIDSSNKYFSKKLPSGCAMIALNDIDVDPESKAIVACGAMKLSKDDLEDYGVKKEIDDETGLMKKGRSVSYLSTGKNVKIDYFATENHSGAHDTFEDGDEPIRGHIIEGIDVNDHIKSLKIVVKSMEGLDIPTKCSDMEIFD
jgi:hypothetical protein